MKNNKIKVRLITWIKPNTHMATIWIATTPRVGEYITYNDEDYIICSIRHYTDALHIWVEGCGERKERLAKENEEVFKKDIDKLDEELKNISKEFDNKSKSIVESANKTCSNALTIRCIIYTAAFAIIYVISLLLGSLPLIIISLIGFLLSLYLCIKEI